LGTSTPIETLLTADCPESVPAAPERLHEKSSKKDEVIDVYE
jgi:hypothetical protein